MEIFTLVLLAVMNLLPMSAFQSLFNQNYLIPLSFFPILLFIQVYHLMVRIISLFVSKNLLFKLLNEYGMGRNYSFGFCKKIKIRLGL